MSIGDWFRPNAADMPDMFVYPPEPAPQLDPERRRRTVQAASEAYRLKRDFARLELSTIRPRNTTASDSGK